MSASAVVDGKRTALDGSALPAHIQALRIPPAWTSVTYSDDPEAALQVKGKDSKGRDQYIYSAKFKESQAAAKFSRVQELDHKYPSVYQENEQYLQSGDPQTRETAACLKLVMETGIRPGGEKDTGGAKKAYGATTLQGRHVVQLKRGTELHFTGKKGVALKIPVKDKEIAADLVRRAEEAGPAGKLFNTTASALSEHAGRLDGGGFHTKDFRTRLGTATATKEVSSRERPKTEKEYKKSVREVAKVVAATLGNTPTIALQSYINPTVFSSWRAGL